MAEFKITEKEVDAAFRAATTPEAKNVLAALFRKGKKPTLDDYKTIRTYEDACEALGELPVNYDEQLIPKHVIALMKLETVSRALWGKDFQPQPDGEGSNSYYFPWFALYTQKEVDDMSEKDRGALLSANADVGAHAGFGCLHTNGRSSHAGADVGFRLCQETEEKAIYFGRQFVKLWAEYICFNFTVGDFTTK